MIGGSKQLSDDELITLTPAGHRLAMIWVALAKRSLLDDRTTPADKLKFLQGMERSADVHFTEEMLRLIEAASDLECSIVREAVALDKGATKPADRLHGSFAVLTDSRVFSEFFTLNPGICAALRWQNERSTINADRPQ